MESPPWDKKLQPIKKIKEGVNKIKMYFKVRSIMNSAKITPIESKKDMKNLFKKFISAINKDSDERETTDKTNIEKKSQNEEIWEEKDITGKIISNMH